MIDMKDERLYLPRFQESELRSERTSARGNSRQLAACKLAKANGPYVLAHPARRRDRAALVRHYEVEIRRATKYGSPRLSRHFAYSRTFEVGGTSWPKISELSRESQEIA